MCRNIRVLHHFEPPTTPDEIRAAAEQYVRKVSGITKLPKSEASEVTRAIDAVAKATAQLLATLPSRGTPRSREGERERAKQRWAAREARIVGTATRKTAGGRERAKP